MALLVLPFEPELERATCGNSQVALILFWLPICNSIRSRPGMVEPEIWFRIVHAAQVGRNCAPVAAYFEQMVEIALGPKGAFENGNIGALWLRAPPGQLVRAVPPGRGHPKPPREPEIPRVVELLRKAIEWQALLESGKIASQVDIARKEGITRARVTQVMGMLRLASEIQERILSMPDTTHQSLITERVLRPIGVPSQIIAVRFESFRGSWTRHPANSIPLHPWLPDGDGRGRSIHDHESDGPRRHQDDDDLCFPWEEPYPGAGGATECHRDSAEQVLPFSRLYSSG